MEDWSKIIRHGGDGCPVPPGTEVRIWLCASVKIAPALFRMLPDIACIECGNREVEETVARADDPRWSWAGPERVGVTAYQWRKPGQVARLREMIATLPPDPKIRETVE